MPSTGLARHTCQVASKRCHRDSSQRSAVQLGRQHRQQHGAWSPAHGQAHAAVPALALSSSRRKSAGVLDCCPSASRLADQKGDHGTPIWSGVSAAIAAGLRACVGVLAAAVITAGACVAPQPAAALTRPSYDDLSRLHYGRSRQPGSALPNAREAETIAELDRDLFTEEAYRGMLEIVKYARYVEGQQQLEQDPGCAQCETNRITLEKAWQVVANEFYDAHGKFSQEAWARALLQTLKDCGGVIRSKHQLNAALGHMVASLDDPYSEWLPPSAFRRALRKPQPAERDYLAMQMTGSGLAIGRHSSLGGWMVDAPLAEGPAEAAGILRGERILQIDDYHVEGTGLTKDEVTALLRGPAGLRVDLQVADAAGHPRHVSLERRSLPQPPVKEARLSLGDGREAAYVRIHYFTSETRRAVQAALLAGEVDGVDGYVIDLRNNPGGVFEEAIAIASLLLDANSPVAATVRTTGGFIDNSFQTGHLPTQIFQNLPGTMTHAPVLLIANRATASASEVLAGALRENGRALLVGEQTLGKGVVQYFFPVHGDGGLKLTVAKYLGPPPHSWDITREGGLLPDVSCSDYPHAGVPSDMDKCIATAISILGKQHEVIPPPQSLYASSPGASTDGGGS